MKFVVRYREQSVRLRALAFLLVLAVGVGLWLLLSAGVWLLWCWVMGAFWPEGPVAIVSPGFWSFVGAWVLFNLLATMLFGWRHG